MDYARFNYVAQPEDNISDKGLFPRIGDYDNWSVEWGYRLFPEFKDADAERAHLNKWVIEKNKNKRLWFGTEINPDDPRSQSEDLGDDAMLASYYGIKNLKRIVPNLHTWTKDENRDFSNLDKMYDQVIAQYNRYMNHVAKNIGGIMETPKMVEQQGNVYDYVPQATQVRAMQFLNTNLFITPKWLIDRSVDTKTAQNPLTIVGGLQDNIINRLVSNSTFSKLSSSEAVKGNAAYTNMEMLTDLRKNIFTELYSGSAVDIYRRGLQKSYINALINYLTPPQTSVGGISFSISTMPVLSATKSDARSIVRAQLDQLQKELKSASNRQSGITKYHYQDLASRINQALDPK